MADTIVALARVRRTHIDDLLPDEPTVQLLRAMGVVWRERLLTPLVTLRLFVLQILHGNTSITHLRQLSGLDFAAASYCEARGRSPSPPRCWMHKPGRMRASPNSTATAGTSKPALAI